MKAKPAYIIHLLFQFHFSFAQCVDLVFLCLKVIQNLLMSFLQGLLLLSKFADVLIKSRHFFCQIFHLCEGWRCICKILKKGIIIICFKWILVNLYGRRHWKERDVFPFTHLWQFVSNCQQRSQYVPVLVVDFSISKALIFFFFPPPSVTLSVVDYSSWFSLEKNRRSSEKELEELKVTAENCLLKNAKTRHNSLEELQQNSFQKKRNSD